MSTKKDSDNFDNIINSLKPIKYKFSTQSHQLDKIFKKLNIESIEKKLHSKGKPPETFKDSLLYKNIDNTYNINAECYDYFEDINGIKKMPIKVEVKGKNFVKHLYNPEFERKIDEKLLNQKEDEPKINNKNIIKFYKGIHQPSFGLDPGYYHPNFNYVKKRIPAFDFGKSSKFYTSQEPDKNADEKNKDNPDSKRNVTEENKALDINNDKTNFENYKVKNPILNNQILKLNLNNNKNKSLFKIKSRNPMDKYRKISSTQKNILPSINLNKENDIKKKSIAKKMNLHTNFKKELSSPNIISFKKMRGRDDENKRLKGSTSDVFYKPNYECNSPHIPGFVFKPSDIRKDYKKYRIGKILRSYIFDPYKYFVMDINENMNNSQEKSNISIHLNKKNKNKSKNKSHNNN
jgi:hypothetical protein